ncbi:hypothetical protein [Streptomyces sp. NBC_00343]|uniref:hypothetical protein n=1 Tax=Streptomyces sp. NBC_00343 TaxID=2975719 RepID=UPI002E2C4B47|nr:hypothetical protein [Streptomyces sp. NBC_00343]
MADVGRFQLRVPQGRSDRADLPLGVGRREVPGTATFACGEQSSSATRISRGAVDLVDVPVDSGGWPAVERRISVTRASSASNSRRSSSAWLRSTVSRSSSHPSDGESAAHGVSAGGLDAVAKAAGPLREKVLAAGQDAFMNAFHGAMTLSAILGFIAAVIGFTMLRTKDLHSSALSTIPPDVDEDGEVRPDDASDLPVGAPA